MSEQQNSYERLTPEIVAYLIAQALKHGRVEYEVQGKRMSLDEDEL